MEHNHDHSDNLQTDTSLCEKAELTEEQKLEEQKNTDLTNKINTLTQTFVEKEGQKQLKELFELVKTLTDEDFGVQGMYILRTGFHLCTEQVILDYLQNQGFKQQQSELKCERNAIAFYIFHKVIENSLDSKDLTKWLIETNQDLKQLDLKFLILEFLLQIIGSDDNRGHYFGFLLPLASNIIQFGLKGMYQLYADTTPELKPQEKDQQCKFISTHMLGFITRFFNKIKDVKELKANKNILDAQDIAQQDEQGNVFTRPLDRVQIVKHFVLLFLSDVMQWLIILSQHDLNAKHGGVYLTKYQQFRKLFTDNITNIFELLQNYNRMSQFSRYTDKTDHREEVTEYLINQQYSVIFIGELLIEAVKQNQFKFCYKPLYQLKFIAPIIHLYFLKEERVLKTQEEMIDVLVQTVARLKPTEVIQNSFELDVDVGNLISAICNAYPQNDKQLVLLSLLLKYSQMVQYLAFEELLRNPQTMNFQRHILDHYLNLENQDPELNVFVNSANLTTMLVSEGVNTHNFLDLADCLVSGVLLMSYLVELSFKSANNSKEYPKGHILNKFESMEIFDKEWKSYLVLILQTSKKCQEFLDQRLGKQDLNLSQKEKFETQFKIDKCKYLQGHVQRLHDRIQHFVKEFQ